MVDLSELSELHTKAAYRARLVLVIVVVFDVVANLAVWALTGWPYLGFYLGPIGFLVTFVGVWLAWRPVRQYTATRPQG